ncbi:hypothetical protein JQ633_01910 [Bradyrhizobium tropiciagri]|uniref:STM3941 family protein n=1 Tax=Bradyrhizobium tropiciagri TaxID=312253 RepID=UPI001BA4FE29|nr:STM3941 family protein [Bradyrhizobium tropiciagri]MBR0869096.1 hypothetical protein [Bradyrhizobium tropiciagri]
MQHNQYLPDIEIGISVWRTLALLAGSVAFALLGASVVFGWLSDGTPDTGFLVLSYLSIVLFGGGACMFAWQLSSPKRAVIFISRQGIRDARSSRTLTPWQSVEAVSIQRVRSQKFVVLKLLPGQTPSTGATGALMDAANKMIGVDGIPIGVTALAVSAEGLLDTCNTYLAAARAMKTRPLPSA